VSVCVQASPSLHVVPFAFGVATQLFVRPSEAQVPVLQTSVSSPQSLSVLQSTAFTHSEGEELGDDEVYEHTSMSSGVVPIGKSDDLTQQWACVSVVVQLVPVQILPLRCEPLNTSATLLATHDDVAVA